MSRFMMPALCLAALCVAGVATAEDEGELAFNKHCRNCHTYKEGDNRLAPSLHGIVGAPGGQVEGYGKYSGALDGITWDEATLDKFIENPTRFIPGTRMGYAGIKDPQERADLIAYLKKAGAGS